jgi:hypothetical protein
VFFRAFLWIRRGRQLGRLLHDLSDPRSRVRLQPSPDDKRRTFRFGPTAWILLPLILVFLGFGITGVHRGERAIGVFSVFLAVFMSLYLWMDSEPRSRESPLGRPSKLGPAFVIICLALITFPNVIGFNPNKSAEDWLLAAFLYLTILWALPPLLISGRNEIRERGLAWAQEKGLAEMLCLRIKRTSQTSREIRIAMRSAHRPLVDSILKSQLSEWP